jgi:hypothetical protein
VFLDFFSHKILKSCWLQGPYAFSMWRFEFKTPFLCRNEGEGKFWGKTQRVSRNWLQKKCSQPMSPLSIERRERKAVGRESRGEASTKWGGKRRVNPYPGLGIAGRGPQGPRGLSGRGLTGGSPSLLRRPWPLRLFLFFFAQLCGKGLYFREGASTTPPFFETCPYT